MANPISITNNGASIKVTNGASIRNIMKDQIIEVSVIKGTTIKIDIGLGALQNVFIPFIDVVLPLTANVDALRDAITDLMAPNSGNPVGSATEARQLAEIDLLTSIDASVTTVKTLVGSIDQKTFFDPLLVDDGGIGVVYKGFAPAGSLQGGAVWAIQRIRKEGDVEVITWADGNKNFDNVWDNREALLFS